MDSAGQLALVTAATALGMCVQSLVGFGFAFFVAPVLSATLEPAAAVTVLLLLGVTINLLIVTSEPREALMGRSVLVLFLIAAMPGLVGGALLLRSLTSDGLQVAIGAAVAVVALFQLARSSWGDEAFRLSGHAGTRSTIAAGLLSGALTTSTSLNGPPVVVWLIERGARGNSLRVSIATALLGLNVAGALVLALLASRAGQGTGALYAVALIPAVLAGHRVGRILFSRIDPDRYVGLVLVAVAFAGAATLVNGLL